MELLAVSLFFSFLVPILIIILIIKVIVYFVHKPASNPAPHKPLLVGDIVQALVLASLLLMIINSIFTAHNVFELSDTSKLVVNFLSATLLLVIGLGLGKSTGKTLMATSIIILIGSMDLLADTFGQVGSYLAILGAFVGLIVFIVIRHNRIESTGVKSGK